MKQISIIHHSAENHQGQKILNAPRIEDLRRLSGILAIARLETGDTNL